MTKIAQVNPNFVIDNFNNRARRVGLINLGHLGGMSFQDLA
jgi:hypothetical protein